MDDALQIHDEAGVRTVVIQREARRNALDDATLEALLGAVTGAPAAGAGAIVLTGAGTTAFSAGSDIKELAGQTLAERIAHTDLGHRVADAIEGSPAVAIAAIEGYCLGGGLELALACDLRIVGEGAVLGLPEVQINALPSWGGTFRLARVVGLGRAKDLVLVGRRLDAPTAVAYGLAGELVPAGAALDRARAIARGLVDPDAATAQRAKALLNAGYGAPAAVGRQLELFADSLQLASGAFDESFRSFGAP
jgi:enoyl-CoA hydratase/carnithine racemase